MYVRAMTDALTSDEIARLRRLLVEDDIRKVKLLYSQLMDAGRIDELAEIFTEDAVCVFGKFGEWHGRDEIRTNFAKVDAEHHDGIPFYALHATTDHWVEVTGPDSAIGRSYLIDIVTETPSDGEPIVVVGVYDETYRKVDGNWQIARCVLQFLWPTTDVTPDFHAPFPQS
jgi:ketosteroid isomerase-like protein